MKVEKFSSIFFIFSILGVICWFTPFPIIILMFLELLKFFLHLLVHWMKFHIQALFKIVLNTFSKFVCLSFYHIEKGIGVRVGHVQKV